MGRAIGFTEFIKRVSTRSKISERTVRKVYDNLFLILAEELRFAGELRLKRIGTFTTQQQGGKDKNVPRPDGSIERLYIEPYYTIKFKPAAEFKNYVNGKIVEKEGKKRLRSGKLTKSDKALIKYKTDDKERNLEIALEKLAEEVRDGKR